MRYTARHSWLVVQEMQQRYIPIVVLRENSLSFMHGTKDLVLQLHSR